MTEETQMKKIAKIRDIIITPEDIVARLVKYEDGTGSVQTFFRPHKKWREGGLDDGTFVISPSPDEDYMKEIGFSDEEVALIFEGFTGPNFD